MSLALRYVLTLGLVLLAGATARDEGVTINANEPTFEIIEFDPADPPADLNLGPDEDALCRFEISVDLRYKFRYRSKAAPEGVTVRLNNLTFTYTLDLHHKIFLPTNASEKLTEHEHGHRIIGEVIFADAERVVMEVVEEVKRKRWEGTGATEKEAAQAATDPMFEQALRDVVDRLTDETQRLNDAFDDLTDHGRNGISTDTGVKKILLENGYEVGSVKAEG